MCARPIRHEKLRVRIIAGSWRGRRLKAPPGRATRPTTDRTREAWMSIVAAEIPGARVLDLFAGSGALGLEALSRGAEHALFVEQAPAALASLKANIAALGAAERAEVVRADALRYAADLEPGAFDLAFADPPYGKGLAEELARLFAQRAFAGLLCIEHGTGDEMPELPGARTRRYGDTLLTFLPAPD
jgi:16S rRNA (guanine966-N2)-methyltransferase